MKTLILIGFIVLIFSVINCGRKSRELSLEEKPGYHLEKIVFPSTKDTLYLSSNTWGITGNHQVIFLTDYLKTDLIYNQEKDYRYRNEYIIYYSQSSDTLTLFVGDKSLAPKNFDSNIKIVQKELKGSDFRTLHENYKDMGINRYDGN